MSVERFELSPGYSISKIIKGGWHLAGGHGQIDESIAIEDMRKFVEAGITTFDCADIYTGVEELIGKFIKKYKYAFVTGDLSPIQIHTKYVPDYDSLKSLKKSDTEAIIDRSLLRLGVDRLDLVQFAWWDYQFPNYVDTAVHLSELQKAGKIRHIGVTNFDNRHLSEIIKAGVQVISNQVQYSVLDHRVEADFMKMQLENPIPYLCYGTVAGGFLSSKYLKKPDPETPYENRSLTKYRLIIEEAGGYKRFQSLLRLLNAIGKKHHVGISEVAIKYILEKPYVGGVIVGARNQNHIDALGMIRGLNLSKEDKHAIKQLIDISPGPLGPFYELERDKKGKHGAIMKYNLNQKDEIVDR